MKGGGVCVCTFVCMYVCMYVCVSVCVCVLNLESRDMFQQVRVCSGNSPSLERERGPGAVQCHTCTLYISLIPRLILYSSDIVYVWENHFSVLYLSSLEYFYAGLCQQLILMALCGCVHM